MRGQGAGSPLSGSSELCPVVRWLVAVVQQLLNIVAKMRYNHLLGGWIPVQRGGERAEQSYARKDAVLMRDA